MQKKIIEMVAGTKKIFLGNFIMKVKDVDIYRKIWCCIMIKILELPRSENFVKNI